MASRKGVRRQHRMPNRSARRSPHRAPEGGADEGRVLGPEREGHAVGREERLEHLARVLRFKGLPREEGDRTPPRRLRLLLHGFRERTEGRRDDGPLPALHVRREAVPEGGEEHDRGQVQEPRERGRQAPRGEGPRLPDVERHVGEEPGVRPQGRVPRRMGLGSRGAGDRLLRDDEAHRDGRSARRVRLFDAGVQRRLHALHAHDDGGALRRHEGREEVRDRQSPALVAERRRRAEVLHRRVRGGGREDRQEDRPPQDRGAEREDRAERQGRAFARLPRQRTPPLHEGRSSSRARAGPT